MLRSRELKKEYDCIANHLQQKRMPYMPQEETHASFQSGDPLLLSPGIMSNLVQFLLEDLHYSFGLLDRTSRTWKILPHPSVVSNKSLIRRILRKSNSSQWNVLSRAEVRNTIIHHVYYMNGGANEVIVLIPSPRESRDEEKIYHEMGVGREIHFTLSTLISLFFISIDAETLQIRYATDNFLDEFGIDLSNNPSLLSICTSEDERQNVRRVFKDVNRMSSYTLRFTFHTSNASHISRCLKGYCVKVSLYSDPIISFVDYTQEEQALILTDFLNSIKPSFSLENTYLLLNNAMNVVWIIGKGNQFFHWNSQPLSEVLIQFEEEEEEVYELKVGECVMLGSIVWYYPSNRCRVVEFIPEKNKLDVHINMNIDSNSKSNSNVIFTNYPQREREWITREIITREGSYFAIYKRTSEWTAVYTSHQLREYLHSKKELVQPIQPIQFQHTCSIEGRLFPQFMNDRDAEEEDTLLSYLSSSEVAKLNDPNCMQFKNKSLHAIITKNYSHQLKIVILTMVLKTHDVSSANYSPTCASSDLHNPFFLLQEIPYPVFFMNDRGLIGFQNKEFHSRFGNCKQMNFTTILDKQSHPAIQEFFPCPVRESRVNHLVYLQSSEYLLSLHHPSSTTYHVLLQPIHDQIILKHYLHRSLSTLSEENTRFRTIFDAVFDGSCIVELQSMTILHPSYSMRTLFACEERGTVLTSFIAEESRSRWLKNVKDVMEKGETVANEKILLKVGDAYRIFSYIMVPISLAYHAYSQAVFCIKDIHQNELLKRKENELQKQVNSLNTLRRAIMDNAFNGTCLLDMETLMPVEFVHALDDNSAEQIVQSFSPLRFRDDIRDALLPYLSELKAKQRLRNVRILVQREIPLHLELNIVYLEDEQKAMMSFRDITQDVEREERAIQLKVEAETANRNKRDFIVGVDCGDTV